MELMFNMIDLTERGIALNTNHLWQESQFSALENYILSTLSSEERAYVLSIIYLI